jgi:hypothetical protein
MMESDDLQMYQCLYIVALIVIPDFSWSTSGNTSQRETVPNTWIADLPLASSFSLQHQKPMLLIGFVLAIST